MRTRITAALVAVLALVSWVSALALPAVAAAPVRLSGEIGTRDILMGVASTDRNHAISADPAMGLSTTELDAVNATAIEPALRQSVWAAAATGAAVGFAAVLAGRPVPAPSLSTAAAPRHGPVQSGTGQTGPGQNGTGQNGTGHGAVASPAVAQAGLTGTDWAAIVGGAVLLLGLLLFTTLALSRRRVAGGRAPAQPAGPSTAELAAQAASALVATDDAIKTSDQELGFAVARFGEQAAAPFSAALKAARTEIAAAFKLRQLLDDDIPETEPVRRSMLTEITGRCGLANQILDEESQAFDELQNLEARAPQVLAEVDHHVTQQDSRADRSEQTLTRLGAKYSAIAVATVTSSPGQARERLEFARGRLAAARQSLAADSAGAAAVSLQAAESAADQAESLLDGIGHLEAELTQAASALPTALREIDADIAEATALHAGPSDGWAAVVARAQAAAAAAREQLAANQPFDPLAALRQVEEAGAELDHSLGSAREKRDRQERARAVLDQAMLVARSSVTAAEDFITTRRGGVGAAARTRLAEAHRHFQQAIAGARDNPEAALAEAQHADVLGQQARSLAEQDVADFSHADHGPVISGGGFGAGFAGAILGGILVDSLFGGGAGSGGRRGVGLGGLGLGGLGLSGLGPGSFGGTGTRGRHSIGGRF